MVNPKRKERFYPFGSPLAIHWEGKKVRKKVLVCFILEY